MSTESIGGLTGWMIRVEREGAFIYDRVAGWAAYVNCPPDMGDTLVAFNNKTVRVDGVVYRDDDGLPVRIDAEHVELVEQDRSIADGISMFADDPAFDPVVVLEQNRS